MLLCIFSYQLAVDCNKIVKTLCNCSRDHMCSPITLIVKYLGEYDKMDIASLLFYQGCM